MAAQRQAAVDRYLPRVPSFLGREWVVYLASALLATIATVWALKLWRADWSVPFYYGTDAILNLAGFKTIVETGWYEFQPLLNAPHGQVFHDWKIADNAGYLFAKLLAVFTSDAGLILNVYFVFGFVAAALSAVWFLRILGVSKALTVALSVLFTLAPYHFLRGENHLFLASYYPIPLALGIAVLIMRGAPVWGLNSSRAGWRRWATGRWLFTVLALALVATANSYYAVFTILFIALAGLIALIRTRAWRRFFGAVTAGVVVVVVMLINMLPDMIYSWQNGSNPEAVARVPYAIEVYALKLAQLVLPMQNHRIGLFNDVRLFYTNNFPPQGEGPVLGTIGAIGFLALLALGVYYIAGAARRTPDLIRDERRLNLGALSAFTLFGFLIATTGGFASLLTYISADLRAWNRISIVLFLFALAAVGILVDAGIRRFGRRRGWRAMAQGLVTVVVASMIFVIGYFDQVVPTTAPDYALTKTIYDRDGAMVAEIEAAVGADASIVQLPYRDFPESAPVNGVSDTDQIKPYTHSSTLSWTGGGIKGRPWAEWVSVLERFPAEEMTQSAAAAGFDGILLDRQAYGDEAGDMVALISAEVGPPVITSDDDRFAFFDLAAASLAGQSRFNSTQLQQVGSWVVNPVLARLEPDVTTSFKGLDFLAKYDPKIMLENPRDSSVDLEVEFAFATDVPPRTLRFTTQDGTSVDARVGPTGTTVTIPVTATPGRSYISITVVSGEPFPSRTHQQATITPNSFRVHDLELEGLLGID